MATESQSHRGESTRRRKAALPGHESEDTNQRAFVVVRIF
jgi:hypothetical protein